MKKTCGQNMIFPTVKRWGCPGFEIDRKLISSMPGFSFLSLNSLWRVGAFL
jgi:hypothetical protein